MDAEQRRARILSMLNKAEKPLSASALAAEFSVSRQIIVGDVALLRASGNEITATPRGYRIFKSTGAVEHRIACRHDSAGMQEELYIIVDQGCTIRDVIVEHPIYGQITGQLDLSSRHDVDEFIKESNKASAKPLSLLTEGIHLHTVLCPNEETAKRVVAALEAKGILYSQTSEPEQ